MAETMTPYERTMRRLRGERVDRAPNHNIFMAFAARYIGSTYDRLASDYRVLVEAQLRTCADFGVDMVSAISDPLREASAFGAEITFPHDQVPQCLAPLLPTARDWRLLQVWEPWDRQRPADRLRAVEAMRREVGGHYAICGWVEGAAAAVAMLRGVTGFLEDILAAPEEAEGLLGVCCETACRFARAQAAAGADVVGVGDSVASLMSPGAYRRFALPYEQRIIAEIHDAGALAKLHICGDISRHLPAIMETGADIVDIDWMVDMREAVRLGGRHGVAICGNFDPVGVMLQGTPEEVAEAVVAGLRAGDVRTISAAGCEVPVDTPHENLRAHHRALVEAGA